MNLPFSVPRPNMDRFNFLSRNRDNSTNTLNRTDDNTYDESTPLSPHLPPDLEAQHPQHRTPEMIQRPAPHASFLPRFRPAIPSWFSVASSRHPGAPRPSSSHYSGDGRAPDTVVDDNGGELESPKTPLFRIRAQDLPSTRLHLPNLARTWTQGSNGPPSEGRASPDVHPDRDEIAMPTPAVTAAVREVAAEEGGETGGGRRHGRHRRGGGEGSSSSHRSRGHRHHHHRSQRSRDGAESGGSRGDGSRSSRRLRRRERERERERGRLDEQEGQQSGERRRRHRRRERRPPPKHFLFCFPWVKSRRMRTHILRCFVSGILLVLLLTVYLALSITKNINNSEFTVLLILIILFITIFFCHGLIRICMMVVKGGRNPEDTDSSTARETTQLPHMYGPGGYAIPREPIRVVMARDEEAAGIESETTKIKPPAYGLWRESVRVDPNRIYWQRNQAVAAATTQNGSSTTTNSPDDSASSESSSSSSPSSVSDTFSTTRRRGEVEVGPRPPSYISDDGVNYVVEAQPRSIAPTTDVPVISSARAAGGVVHPSEMGRAGRPAGW